MHYRLSDVAEVAGLAHGSARVMRHRGQLGIARYAHRLSLTDACIIVLTGRLTDLLGMPAAGAARIASQARAIIAEVAGRWDRGGDDDTFLVFFTLPGGIWCEPAHGRMELVTQSSKTVSWGEFRRVGRLRNLKKLCGLGRAFR